MTERIYFHRLAVEKPTPATPCPAAQGERVVVDGFADQPWTVRRIYDGPLDVGYVLVGFDFPDGPQAGYVGQSADVPTARLSTVR